MKRLVTVLVGVLVVLALGAGLALSYKWTNEPKSVFGLLDSNPGTASEVPDDDLGKYAGEYAIDDPSEDFTSTAHKAFLDAVESFAFTHQKNKVCIYFRHWWQSYDLHASPLNGGNYAEEWTIIDEFRPNHQTLPGGEKRGYSLIIRHNNGGFRGPSWEAGLYYKGALIDGVAKYKGYEYGSCLSFLEKHLHRFVQKVGKGEEGNICPMRSASRLLPESRNKTAFVTLSNWQPYWDKFVPGRGLDYCWWEDNWYIKVWDDCKYHRACNMSALKVLGVGCQEYKSWSYEECQRRRKEAGLKTY